MGDPRRLRPKYETPKVVWNKERIEAERKLIEEYGLKNMREVWIAQKEVRTIRRIARNLLSLGEKGDAASRKIINKAVRLGFVKEGAGLDDLLALSVRDVLERRLETRVQKRGLSRSLRQARQLITHGFISVGGRKASAPGYIVPVSEEQTITYFKAIDLNAPVMAQARQDSAGSVQHAETPEADAAPAAEAVPAAPAEAAS
jgi:small subunit ribosomal protein S4